MWKGRAHVADDVLRVGDVGAEGQGTAVAGKRGEMDAVYVLLDVAGFLQSAVEAMDVLARVDFCKRT